MKDPAPDLSPALVGGEGFFRRGCSLSFLGPAWWCANCCCWCFRHQTRAVALLSPLEVTLASSRALGVHFFFCACSVWQPLLSGLFALVGAGSVLQCVTFLGQMRQ